MFFDAESDELGEDEEKPEEQAETMLEKPTVLHAVDTQTQTDPDDEPPKPPTPGRPNLRVIK